MLSWVKHDKRFITSGQATEMHNYEIKHVQFSTDAIFSKDFISVTTT